MTELELLNEFSLHFINLNKEDNIALANFKRKLHGSKNFKKVILSRQGRKIARIAKDKGIYQWYRKTLLKYMESFNQ